MRSPRGSARLSCASAWANHVPGAVAWNLFDIDTRFGDVESLETVLGYLSKVEPVSKHELSGVGS